MLDGVFHVPGHVVHRRFVNETVVLNLETGQYHGLNPVGGLMLEALARHGTVRDAVPCLAEEFEGVSPSQIERDLHDFCSDLLARGLIEVDPNGDR
jgi:hypothetical protein